MTRSRVPRRTLSSSATRCWPFVSAAIHSRCAREIAGLSKSSAIVPVPCATPALLGIMGLRGALLPIFDLAELLGYARPERAARWVAVCGGSQPLGLAFAQFEHCFQAGPSDLSSVDGAESRNHSHEVVRASGAVRHIVDIPSVVRVIRSVRAKGNLPLEKER